LRRFNYAEAHWLANPGAYQHCILAYNDAGASAASWPNVRLIFGEAIGTFRAGAWAHGEVGQTPTGLARFRRETVPNTIAFVGPRFHIEDYPVSVDPDVDEVRTIN
jgi:hypothetical protein